MARNRHASEKLVANQARRLQALELENVRLRRAVSDLMLDRLIWRRPNLRLLADWRVDDLPWSMG